MIRYEVEVLRCRDVVVDIDDEQGVDDDDAAAISTIRQQTRRACCTEPNYPCATPKATDEAEK